MTRAGIKQARLAEMTGFSKGYVSGLVSGSKVNPSPDAVVKFAKVLHCSPEFLVYGDVPDPPHVPKYGKEDCEMRDAPVIQADGQTLDGKPQPTLAEAIELMHTALDLLKQAVEEAGKYNRDKH